jgi:hypothetical protein
MNGFRKIFPSFLSHYATFFAKMAERKVVPFDEFYYQLKLTHLFQKHPVYVILITNTIANSRLCISLRVEVSLFMLSPQIEYRDEVEVNNWA